MNAHELANKMEQLAGHFHNEAINMLRQQANDVGSLNARLKQQADRITELEKELYFKNYYEELPDTPVGIIGKIGDCPIHDLVHRTTPQIKELSDEENNLKWWISSFEHLKTLGGGISDEMEAKLKEMKERLKKASEK